MDCSSSPGSSPKNSPDTPAAELTRLLHRHRNRRRHSSSPALPQSPENRLLRPAFLASPAALQRRRHFFKDASATPPARQDPFNDVAALEALAGKDVASSYSDPSREKPAEMVSDEFLRAPSVSTVSGTVFILDEVQCGLSSANGSHSSISMGLDPDILCKSPRPSPADIVGHRHP